MTTPAVFRVVREPGGADHSGVFTRISESGGRAQIMITGPGEDAHGD